VDLLEKAMAWLEGKRHELRTGEITYVRGGESVLLRATVGKTVFQTQNAHGILETTESRDFLVRTRDLVLGGSQTFPHRGDRIREERDGTVYVYEVMAPGREPHYRFSDPYRYTLRIHTKQIDVETV